MVKESTLEEADKKASKFRKGLELANDIGGAAVSATGLWHIAQSFLGVEPPEDAPAAAKLIYGGHLTPADEALIEGIEQEIRDKEEDPTQGIQGSMDRLRAYMFAAGGDSWLGKKIAQWYLNALRKQILYMRDEERLVTNKTHTASGKGGTKTTTEHTVIPVNTEVAKKFMAHLHKIDMEAQKKNTSSDQNAKELAGCKAMGQWLHLKSMPGPYSVESTVKTLEPFNGTAESMRKQLSESANNIRRREASLPRWRQWLRN